MQFFVIPLRNRTLDFGILSTRQPSDTAHRSADYTAQDSSRASTSCQKKHHPDHPCSASTLYSFRAIYSRDLSPRNSLLRSTATYRRPYGLLRVRFEIGGRGGRSKESRGVRNRASARRTVGRGEQRRDGHNRPMERDVRCHLATYASSFMPLDSGDRT